VKGAKLIRAIVILALAIAAGIAIAKLSPGLMRFIVRAHGGQ
jgi:hypothetical protein